MEPNTEETTKKEEKGTFWKDAADMLEAVLISIFCVIMLFAYVLRPVTVEGHSMESTLQDQDKLFMTDLFYTPERGDIVIIDNDASHTFDENGNLVEGQGLSTVTTEKRLIKRIIAVGGETLDINFDHGTFSCTRWSNNKCKVPIIDFQVDVMQSIDTAGVHNRDISHFHHVSYTVLSMFR